MRSLFFGTSLLLMSFISIAEIKEVELDLSGVQGKDLIIPLKRAIRMKEGRINLKEALLKRVIVSAKGIDGNERIDLFMDGESIGHSYLRRAGSEFESAQSYDDVLIRNYNGRFARRWQLQISDESGNGLSSIKSIKVRYALPEWLASDEFIFAENQYGQHQKYRAGIKKRQPRVYRALETPASDFYTLATIDDRSGELIIPMVSELRLRVVRDDGSQTMAIKSVIVDTLDNGKIRLGVQDALNVQKTNNDGAALIKDRGKGAPLSEKVLTFRLENPMNIRSITVRSRTEDKIIRPKADRVQYKILVKAAKKVYPGQH